MSYSSAIGRRISTTQMHFAFMFSLVIAILAVVSLFVAIPFVSDYAFWFAVLAYVLLAGSRK